MPCFAPFPQLSSENTPLLSVSSLIIPEYSARTHSKGKQHVIVPQHQIRKEPASRRMQVEGYPRFCSSLRFTRPISPAVGSLHRPSRRGANLARYRSSSEPHTCFCATQTAHDAVTSIHFVLANAPCRRTDGGDTRRGQDNDVRSDKIGASPVC